MLPALPVYVSQSQIHGLGLFASCSIESGQVIGTIESRPTVDNGPHVLWLDDETAVEVCNEMRFINHDDEPNACYYDDLTIAAVRDIAPGEEITHNYCVAYEASA